MARTTYIKSAQQRYATKPVLNPDGSQKTVAVSNRDGSPKVSKRGPVVRRLTERDLSKPLPMPTCDYPGCQHETRDIKVGEPYKWIAPKSGPYGGRALHRHGDCPNWNVWDYSYSTSARVAQVSNDIEEMLATYTFGTVDDFEDAVQAAAEMAGELRDEKEEALQNMPEALQDGSQTQEQFEALEQWVSEIEQATAPDWDNTCTECDGRGQVDDPDASGNEGDDMVDCEECDGSGELGDEPDEDWADEARAAIMDAVQNCGV